MLKSANRTSGQRALGLLLAAMIATIGGAQAMAADIPAARGQVTQVHTVPGSPSMDVLKQTTLYAGEDFSVSQTADPFWNSGAVRLSEMPSVLAEASSSATEAIAGTYSNALYYMSVDGPLDAVVPVRMRGRVEVSVDETFRFSFGAAGAQVSLRDFASNAYVGGASLYADFGYSAPVQRSVFDQTFSLRGGHIYLVALGAQAIAQGINADYEAAFRSSRAFADPYFNIDPDFLAANPGFSLAFSPGVGNTLAPPGGAVPEPATWAMMIAGFGAVGSAMRSRRRALA